LIFKQNTLPIKHTKKRDWSCTLWFLTSHGAWAFH